MHEMYDLFIIGGGINGVGIARDAAGRGLKVGLCERGDLGSETSSASTKLIHGGLRYLEHYEFRLVRESLKEREVLWNAAPHIIWPLRFVLPHHSGLRPTWLLRLGLFLYDHIGGRKLLPPTVRRSLTGSPLKDSFSTGFEYSDCWVEDSRLVVLNAMDARDRGSDIFTHTSCVGAERNSDAWTVHLRGEGTGSRSVQARTLVNAAGPWASEVTSLIAPGQNRQNTRLIKGSHLVVRRMYEGDHAYILQNSDDRIVFVIPYEGNYSLIGTTDVIVSSPDRPAAASDEEASYLLELVNGYFEKSVRHDDIVWSYSGIRPLFDDGDATASKVTRDYELRLDGKGPPALSVFGGKITTYRKLAEEALERLRPFLPEAGKAWTKNAALPGGESGASGWPEFVETLLADYPAISPSLVARLAKAYGSRTYSILGNAHTAFDLGEHFGAGLYAAEVAYLVENEFVASAQDVLWRRSKLGLLMQPEQVAFLERYISKQRWSGLVGDPAIHHAQQEANPH